MWTGMKKTVLIIAAALVLFNGCYRDDIDELRNDINRLKEQMAQYEALLNALSQRLYIVGYEVSGGNFTVTLSDGSKLLVNNSPSFITVGDNGNWWIDDTDTQKPAGTEQPVITIGSNSNWWIDGVDTGIDAGKNANKGASEIIAISYVDGIMTFTFSDGRAVQLQTARIPEVSITPPTGGFVFDKMQWVRIAPVVGSADGAVYRWALAGATIGNDKDLQHVFATAGEYELYFSAKNQAGERAVTVAVTIRNRDYVHNPTRVFDYFPAPGQFINTMPAATTGDTDETMRQKAEADLKEGIMVCLGGFGGYVVMGFDHTIVNRAGNDFVVLGNALDNWAEPGVISVSSDVNGNGLPDDEWYEIAGSEYRKPATIKNYAITYYKPTAEPANANEPDYIRWSDNQGQTGYLAKNTYHRQTYYPLWKGASITLKGTFMECLIHDTSGNGTYFINPPYEFGYADNYANTDARAQIDISWAVDSNGNPVTLKGIDFMKVYTGNRAEGGWLGEVSTEVAGVKDLNLE
jgi:hypothetical protein